MSCADLVTYAAILAVEPRGSCELSQLASGDVPPPAFRVEPVWLDHATHGRDIEIRDLEGLRRFAEG